MRARVHPFFGVRTMRTRAVPHDHDPPPVDAQRARTVDQRLHRARNVGRLLLDDTLALLYAHPQVYLDTGVIVYTQPRPAFYRYLGALVDAGFGKRIMFGSDQLVWPETMERGIAVIKEAPFLTAEQKRDILYNNAARFLKLDEATIARHHAM